MKPTSRLRVFVVPAVIVSMPACSSTGGYRQPASASTFAGNHPFILDSHVATLCSGALSPFSSHVANKGSTDGRGILRRGAGCLPVCDRVVRTSTAHSTSAVLTVKQTAARIFELSSWRIEVASDVTPEVQRMLSQSADGDQDIGVTPIDEKCMTRSRTTPRKS